MTANTLSVRPRHSGGRREGQRGSRFGSPLRVHWVRPELVAEVKFLTWTDDNLLRQVVYEGLHEDKPASQVLLDLMSRQAKPEFWS